MCETMVFPANKKGEVVDWGGLCCVHKYDVRQVLANMGYTVIRMPKDQG